ncbi:uncharacterized protein JCM10292_004773 [Rhodotorula paludigena]|uniref:uncharacterized protein n=1 Tax=Rhodotorula paludigena TaxID=86838 RepID=UPI00317AFF6C
MSSTHYNDSTSSAGRPIGSTAGALHGVGLASEATQGTAHTGGYDSTGGSAGFPSSNTGYGSSTTAGHHNSSAGVTDSSTHKAAKALKHPRAAASHPGAPGTAAEYENARKGGHVGPDHASSHTAGYTPSDTTPSGRSGAYASSVPHGEGTGYPSTTSTGTTHAPGQPGTATHQLGESVKHPATAASHPSHPGTAAELKDSREHQYGSGEKQHHVGLGSTTGSGVGGTGSHHSSSTGTGVTGGSATDGSHHKPTITDKLVGGAEALVGKATGNHDKVEQGQARQHGGKTAEESVKHSGL